MAEISGRLRGRIAGILLLVGLALVAGPSSAADPDALWKLVNGRCVPDQQTSGNPAPCAKVDLTDGVAAGYVVLKDNSPNKPTHFLLIPTARITGIESPLVLAPGTPNYFADAWAARIFVEGLVHHTLARDRIGLAINSVSGRSQDQLHIHIDCIRPDVQAALAREQAAMTDSWTIMAARLQGHRYRVMKLPGADLAAVRPFELVATGIPGADQHMGAETIVVVGAVFADGSPGFYLLNDSAEPATGDLGSGEDLLATCTDG